MLVSRGSLATGVVVSDESGTIISANEGASNMFGFKRSELLGNEVTILMGESGAYRHQHPAYMASYLESGKSRLIGKNRVIYATHKRGHSLALTLSLSHMKSNGVDVFCALFQKHRESSLVVVGNRAGLITKVSGNPVAMLGYSTEELLTLDIAALCPAAGFEFKEDGATSQIFGQTTRNLAALHKDGHLVPISLYVEPTLDRGQLVGFNGRITQVEGDVEGILSICEGVIQKCSGGIDLLFGYAPVELTGLEFSVLCPSCTLARFQVALLQHKDKTRFFGTIETNPYAVGKDVWYRCIIRRSVAKRHSVGFQAEEQTDSIFKRDLVGFYEINCTLGVGYFGPVKLATHRLTGQKVAVKCLRKTACANCDMDFPPAERKYLERLDHPNVVKLLDYFRTEEAVFLVMENINGGELFDYVLQRVAAVDYMHRSGVVHRDLKLENILISPVDRKITVIDLGFAAGVEQSSSELTRTFCGSVDYAAPELYMGVPYGGPQVDIWAMGVILYIMATCYIPFEAPDDTVKMNYSWPLEIQVSGAIKALISEIFQPMEQRIDMESILVHPFFAGVSIERKRAGSSSCSPDIDVNIIKRVVSLGFRESDIRQAVAASERNQMSISYNLLKRVEENGA